MSNAEMKQLLHVKVDALDENRLQLVNEYTELINSDSKIQVAVISHALEIIKERGKLLEKLAH